MLLRFIITVCCFPLAGLLLYRFGNFGLIPIVAFFIFFYMLPFIGNIKIFTCENEIRNWLKEYNYKCEELSYRMIAYNFGLSFDRTFQPTYKATVKNPKGEDEVLWFTFGTWWLGMFSDRMLVLDDERNIIFSSHQN